MFDFKVLLESTIDIAAAVPRTLVLAIVILLLSLVVGTVIALIQQFKVPVFSQIIKVLQSFLRGTPNVVLLLLMYYALPEILSFFAGILGIEFDPNNLNPVITVIVTFTISYSVFQSEIIRGSILSIDKGQIEAAQSLGFSSWQTFRRVIVPQALVEAFPDIINSLMVIIKALSLAYLITVVDILAQAKMVGALTYRYLEAFIGAALIYWMIGIILTFVANRFELKLRRGFH
ncbi:amino acid ABC transporter permease [Lysinibacillus yapensis]|uniref:Amino acid ABC transporter permease n=1 Tax=Ureibacillus yapensis TaxID=2304605 RepID=A0A396SDG1_9BACL|nr:amino acid ABC transporter permease [Lysinibacillus yapensis]RHW35844.1 amino acid ABC transporter permease [Lysinibacillus yapensis]